MEREVLTWNWCWLQASCRRALRTAERRSRAAHCSYSREGKEGRKGGKEGRKEGRKVLGNDATVTEDSGCSGVMLNSLRTCAGFSQI